MTSSQAARHSPPCEHAVSFAPLLVLSQTQVELASGGCGLVFATGGKQKMRNDYLNLRLFDSAASPASPTRPSEAVSEEEEERRSGRGAFRLAREAEWSESVWTLSASPFFLSNPKRCFGFVR